MIYLDHHATTPCDPAVIAAMLPYFGTAYGNASSDHVFGQAAADAVDKATAQLAGLLNTQPSTLVFTSGATESNNLAILGMANSSLAGGRRKLATTQIEHKSVLAPLQELEKNGWQLGYLPLDSVGRVDVSALDRIIDENTALVSVQTANSEIGTIQDIAAIAKVAHSKGALFHTDATQALGKMDLDLEEMDIDMASFSAHKMYGPKGVGALYIREPLIRKLQPLMFGGGQSRGIRPGTMPVPLIVGFGFACEILSKTMKEENARLHMLRDELELLLTKKFPGVIINGDRNNRLPNNSNITFPGVDAEALLSQLQDIIASTGSACESGSIEPSRVLTAIGIDRDLAYNSLRFGLGRFNTMDEIKQAAEEISASCNSLFLELN